MCGVAAFPGLYFAISRTVSYMAFRLRELWSPILEIGVGNGLTSNLIFAGCSIDIGSNPTDELTAALRRATAVHRDVRRIDAQAIDLPDASVATVLANNCMYHIADCRRALRELFRVLRPGGTVLFNFPRPDLVSGVSRITQTLLKAAGADDILDEYLHHRRSDYGARHDPFHDIADIAAYAASIGFDVRESKPCMSDALFDFAHFFADMDDLIGPGASSYLHMEQFPGNRDAWKVMLSDVLAARVIPDQADCARHGSGAVYFFALRKPG
jgi:SAM-dependent methyltransferase